MPSVRELKGRIRAVQNIQKITKAMKLVAAARQKKAQDRVNSARPYSEKINEVMRALVASTGGKPAAVFADSPVSTPASREAELLLTPRTMRNRGILVIGAERGLCGSYNTNLLRRVMLLIRDTPRSDVQAVTVGKKATAFLQKRGYHIERSEAMPAAAVPFSLATRLGQTLRALYTQGKVDSVQLIYTRSLSAMVQRPTEQTLLPVELKAEDDKSRRHAEYLFEPSAPELLSALVPRYVDTLIYQALLEANAGEHGARMIAMTSATDNASEIEERLTLLANRARQAGITKEILEVVGGAEALKG